MRVLKWSHVKAARGFANNPLAKNSFCYLGLFF